MASCIIVSGYREENDPQNDRRYETTTNYFESSYEYI